MKSFAIVTFAFTVVACSSSSSSSVTVDQACSDYASATCGKANGCAPLFIAISYGDATTCTTRFKALCASAFAANGTSLTTDRVEACAKAFTSGGCDALLDRNTPADCRATAGKLVNGTACGDDNQCASAYCNRGANTVCGTCGTGRAKAGDTCQVDDNCDYGLVCAANGACVARGDAGATCDANHPCKSTLYCNTAMGMGTGTCATPAAEGAMCTSGGGLGSCSGLAGDFCNPKTNVCQKLAVAAGGAACGYDTASGNFTLCSANGLCKTTGTSLAGTCLAAAADGAACNATSGPHCMAGAECVNAVCQKTDASSCK